MDLKLVSLAVALLIAACAADSSRLVGGSHTTIQDFPYIVALVYTYPGPGITVQRCVGSLVSSWHVLTTAFCFTGANLDQMLVRAGSTNSLSGGSTVTISHIEKHPDYVETPRAGDVAVAFLSWPLGISSNINVLYLPQQNQYIPDWSALKIVSWGFDSDGTQLETLKTITLFKLPLEDCQRMYQGVEDVLISDPVICGSALGPIGMCQGDSGAPVVIGQALVGLASFYHDECGNDVYADVFTRIDRYTNWILQVAVAPGRAGTPVRVATALNF